MAVEARREVAVVLVVQLQALLPAVAERLVEAVELLAVMMVVWEVPMQVEVAVPLLAAIAVEEDFLPVVALSIDAV